MSQYISDCCSLINLYCGFGGIQILHEIGNAWYIGNKALDEAQYARDLNAAGQPMRVDLTPTLLHSQYPLSVLTAMSTEENAISVKLSKIMGDGEAQAFVLARSKSLPLLIDDYAAIKGAIRSGISIHTISTPEILILWAGQDASRRSQLPSVVDRIDKLAKFSPHKSSAHLEWWQAMLAKHKSQTIKITASLILPTA